MRRVVVRLENTTDVTVSALMQILNRTLRRPHIVRTDARQIPPRKFAVQQDTRQALFKDIKKAYPNYFLDTKAFLQSIRTIADL